MKELTIEQYLKACVEDIGHTFGMRTFCIKLSPLVFTGLPDRLVILPNLGDGDWHIGFCELKRKGGSIRKRQHRVMAQLERLGCEVALIDSKRDVDQWLRRWKSEKD